MQREKVECVSSPVKCGAQRVERKDGGGLSGELSIDTPTICVGQIPKNHHESSPFLLITLWQTNIADIAIGTMVVSAAGHRHVRHPGRVQVGGPGAHWMLT